MITTDLLPETPGLLSEKIANAVIFQNPFKQGKNVIRAIYEHIIGTPASRSSSSFHRFCCPPTHRRT